MTEKLVFVGTRSARSGPASVKCNGVDLSLYTAHCNHSPDGFQWGYEGSGPAQLAFCILMKYFLEKGMSTSLAAGAAWKYHQWYKRDVIATLTMDSWTLTGDQVELWLTNDEGA